MYFIHIKYTCKVLSIVIIGQNKDYGVEKNVFLAFQSNLNLYIMYLINILCIHTYYTKECILLLLFSCFHLGNFKLSGQLFNLLETMKKLFT